jgi:hypothetical protein
MQVEAFPGWSSVWAQLAAMDPRKLWLSAVRAAWKSAKAENGVFVGDAVLHFKNHSIFVRLALRAQMDGLGTEGSYDVVATKALLRQLSQRGEELLLAYYATVPDDSEAHRQERIVVGSWLTALTYRGRNRSAKFELARAWILLRRKWREKRETLAEMYEAELQIPLSTAFDSIEGGLFLAVMMMQADGFVPDPVRALGETHLGNAAEAFVTLYSVDATTLVAGRETLEQYPAVGLENPFMAEPILRMPDGSLVAPDPGALLTCIEERLVDHALRPFIEEGGRREKLARTMRGYVFESYLADVLCEIGRASLRCRHVDEFQYAVGDQVVRSPDGFLVNDVGVIAFEAKATRFPRPIEAQLSVEALLGWMGKVAGELPDRLPLTQGARFVEHWIAGNAGIVAQLGPWRGHEAFSYLLVTAEDPPFIVPSPEFRDRYWHPRLGNTETALDARSSFVSIKDIEVLHCAASVHLKAKTNFDGTRAIRDWEKHRASGPHSLVQAMNSTAIEFKRSLADYLVEKYQGASTEFPDLQRDAFEELCAETRTKFFGEK